MSLLKRVVFSVALLGTVGCAHESSVLVSGASPSNQRISSTRRTFLWGIASDATWDPRAQCANGISKVDVTSIFSIIGIYASYELVATCAVGQPMSQGPGYGYGQASAGVNGGSVIVIPR